MTDCGVYDELTFSLAAETEPKALKLNLQKPSVLNVELLPKEGCVFDLMRWVTMDMTSIAFSWPTRQDLFAYAVG